MLSNPQKPYKMFHSRADSSLEYIKRATKEDYDIIELDVRKSKDDVLFCYHDSLFATLLRFLDFKNVKKIISVNKLEDILKVIDVDKIVFLDIKDKDISTNDLDNVCCKFNKEFWLAGYSLKQLAKFRQEFGDKYKYIYNFAFLFFKIGLKKVVKAKIDAIKIFPWHYNKKNMDKLKNNNIAYALQEYIVSQKKLKQIAKKYGSLWLIR